MDYTNRERVNRSEEEREEVDRDRVDRLLDERARHRGTIKPSGRYGEITNPETNHQETTQDREETDPFEDGEPPERP